MTNLDPTQKVIISRNIEKTGNAFPDISIDGHVHDFKASDKISASKNHISLWDHEQVLKDGIKTLTKISRVLAERIHLHEINNKVLSKELLEFNLKAFNVLNNILYEKASSEQKIQAWYEFVQKTMHKRPDSFTIPIFIPTSNKPFVPDPSLLEKCQKIVIPEGHLDYVKTKQALLGVLWKESSGLRDAVAFASYGALDANQFISANSTDI